VATHTEEGPEALLPSEVQGHEVKNQFGNISLGAAQKPISLEEFSNRVIDNPWLHKFNDKLSVFLKSISSYEGTLVTHTSHHSAEIISPETQVSFIILKY